MTMNSEQINQKVDGTRNVVNGKIKQATGAVREQWGKLSNDEVTRLTGKKDRVIGKFQSDYGDSWIFRNYEIVLMGIAVATLGGIFAFIFSRYFNNK